MFDFKISSSLRWPHDFLTADKGIIIKAISVAGAQTLPCSNYCITALTDTIAFAYRYFDRLIMCVTYTVINVVINCAMKPAAQVISIQVAHLYLANMPISGNGVQSLTYMVTVDTYVFIKTGITKDHALIATIV